MKKILSAANLWQQTATSPTTQGPQRPLAFSGREVTTSKTTKEAGHPAKARGDRQAVYRVRLRCLCPAGERPGLSSIIASLSEKAAMAMNAGLIEVTTPALPEMMDALPPGHLTRESQGSSALREGVYLCRARHGRWSAMNGRDPHREPTAKKYTEDLG